MVEVIIKAYAKNTDKETLDIILSDYLLDSFQEFDENIRYVEEKLGIFQLYDNTKFEQDKEKWNEEYLYKEKGRLITNFSKERVEHIKKIIRKLYPERNKEISRATNYSLGTSNKKTTSNKRVVDKGIIQKIVIIGGIVVVVAVICGVTYLYNKYN